MSEEGDYFGSINQALYFARLLAERGESLQRETSGSGQFQRQQLQCYCEASLDALHRALYFLIHSSVPASHQSGPQRGGDAMLDPRGSAGGMERLLESSLQQQPSQIVSELLAELQLGKTLAAMLVAYRALWQSKHPSKKSAKNLRQAGGEISVAEIHLTPADCLAWQKEITQLHLRVREQSAEY